MFIDAFSQFISSKNEIDTKYSEMEQPFTILLLCHNGTDQKFGHEIL